MNTGVADRFLEVFSRYIDSGFGLLGGEVAFVASTLVVIDVTLAALFWSWSAGDGYTFRRTCGPCAAWVVRRRGRGGRRTRRRRC